MRLVIPGNRRDPVYFCQASTWEYRVHPHHTVIVRYWRNPQKSDSHFWEGFVLFCTHNNDQLWKRKNLDKFQSSKNNIPHLPHRINRMMWTQCCITLVNIYGYYTAIMQIPQCTYPISNSISIRTEMSTFLFWMVQCEMWARSTVKFVTLFYWLIRSTHRVLTPTANFVGPTLTHRRSCRFPVGPTWAQRALLSGKWLWYVSTRVRMWKWNWVV